MKIVTRSSQIQVIFNVISGRNTSAQDVTLALNVVKRLQPLAVLNSISTYIAVLSHSNVKSVSKLTLNSQIYVDIKECTPIAASKLNARIVDKRFQL